MVIAGNLLPLLGVGFLVFVLVICLYIYFRFSYFAFQEFKGSGIKGPPPSFFFGHYQDFSKLGLVKYLKCLHEDYGPIARFHFGIRPYVSVKDPELIKLITIKDFENFINREKLPDFFGRKPGETQGIGLDRDEIWRVGRQTLSPTFSTGKMKAMTPLIHDSVKTLVEIFREHADTDKSVEFLEIYRRYSMETIIATAFGRVINVQRNESDELAEAGISLFGSFKTKQEQNIKTQYLSMMLLFNLPWLEPIIRFMAQYSPRVKAFKVLTNAAIRIVKKRRAEGNPGRYKDLLQLMMDAAVEDGGNTNAGKFMTNEEIIAHSTTFMIAGFAGTSNALAIMSYLLAIHPDMQEKLQEEIDSYFEENPEASLYQAVQDIGYLDLFFQESLRVYNVADPVILRECNKDYTYKDVTIPKGVVVYFPVEILHNDPEYWEDPKKFDPMRFTPEEKAKRPQQCYIPFGSGRRNCIGMRFAMLVTKAALIEVIKEFTIVKAPDTVLLDSEGTDAQRIGMMQVLLKVVTRK